MRGAIMGRWATFMSAMCCVLLAASTAGASTGVPKGWSKVGGAGKVPVYRMDFTDATHGLAYYYNVGFKKTSDGGKTWKSMGKVPSALMGVTDLAMGSSSVGYIVGPRKESGSPCGLYVTHNGGKTWTDRGSALGHGNLTRVCVTDAKRAWAFGDGWLIYVTTDGGNTWRNQYGDPYGFGQIHGADFTDSNHGWASGTIHDLYLGDQVVFLRTVNGGQTWSSTSMAGTPLLTGLEFANSQRGWAAGALPNSIYSTTNGGVTWQVKSAPVLGGPTVMLGFASASKGWLVGGFLWQTTNGGTTWSQYLSTSRVNAFDMARRTSAFIHVMTPGYKFQLYRWKK